MKTLLKTSKGLSELRRKILHFESESYEKAELEAQKTMRDCKFPFAILNKKGNRVIFGDNRINLDEEHILSMKKGFKNGSFFSL